MAGVLIIRTQSRMQRAECHVKAESGVTPSRAKDAEEDGRCRQPGEGRGRVGPPSTAERAGPCRHPDSRLSGPQNCEGINSCPFKAV